jgi:tetratricopeptide (TPR) repeat protein
MVVGQNQPAPAPTSSAPAVTQAKPAEPVDPDLAMWLVNLARHQGHLVGRSDPRRASLHVVALLEAAANASSDCAEAQYWLYDLYHRMDRAESALTALTRYVQLMPKDDAARVRLLELRLEAMHTGEERLALIKSELASKPASPLYESELHRNLAKHHYERRENEPAGKEAEAALRLNPMNVAARELAYEIFGETEPALQRVEMALQLISINPSQANLMWDLAEFLDQLSLHHQAQEWYNRAIEVHRRANPGLIPAEYLHRLAVSYSYSGDFEKSKETADKALESNAEYHLARLLRADVLTKLGKADAAKADMDIVVKAYETKADAALDKKDPLEAATLAWFFTYHHSDKDRASKLADLAMKAEKPDSLARLAHGYALHQAGKTEDAAKELQMMASEDQMAALELAKIRIEQSRKADAITLLHKAATIQYSGIAYNQVKELLAKYGEKAAEPPLNTKVVTALDKFPRDILDFHRRPGDFLKFTTRFEPPQPPTAGPLNVVLRLENAAPFTISFGEGYMVRPLVAISAKIGGKEGKSFKNYLQVLMNARPILLPGDAFEKSVAVDVGPVREYLLRTIPETVGVEITAMLDPVRQNNELASGLGTVVATPLAMERTGLPLIADTVSILEEECNSQDVARRMAVAEMIGALLVEARAGSSAKAAPEIAEGLSAMLAKLLADKDWRVRVHALVGAGWSTLDAKTTAAAAPSIRDEKPIVRLLAVRLFATQQGEKFAKVLDHLSKTDPAKFVRIMASSYLPESTSANAGELSP